GAASNRGRTTPAPGGRGAASGSAATASGSRAGGSSNPSLRLSASQMNPGTGRGSGPRTISSLFELIGTHVSVPGNSPQSQPRVHHSPLNDPGTQHQFLPVSLDPCTPVNSPETPALINVNTASQPVPSPLPGLSDADVQNIITHRPDSLSTDPPD